MPKERVSIILNQTTTAQADGVKHGTNRFTGTVMGFSVVGLFRAYGLCPARFHVCLVAVERSNREPISVSPPKMDIAERDWKFAKCHFRTSGDFIDRNFARDALERRALWARGDAGILQQRRRLRTLDNRLAGEDRV
jgi:hypothetical protein